MHDQDMAIVRALVPVAWADGNFAQPEEQMLEAFLDAYHATDAERATMRTYAKTKRTLDDIDLQALSSDDRRILLQHAVLVCFADGDYSDAEKKFIADLSQRLRIPAEEVPTIVDQASARAKKHLDLL